MSFPRLRILRVLLAAVIAVLAGCGGGGGGAAAPSAPVGLTAAWLGPDFPGAVVLTWTPPPGSPGGYIIEARRGTEAFARISGSSPLSGTAQRFDCIFDPAATPEGVNLDFRMVTVDGGAKSDYSNVASLTVPIRAPGPIGVAHDEGALRLRWTNNSTLADTLLVERGFMGTSTVRVEYWTPLPGIRFGDLEYLDSEAPEDVNVMYRVTYSKGAVTGQGTSVVVQTALWGVGNLTATPGLEQVGLQWVNRSPRATSILIGRMEGIDQVTFKDIAVLPPTATSFVDTQVPTGAYTYQVRVRRGENASWPYADRSVNAVTLPYTRSSLSLIPSFIRLPGSDSAVLRPDGDWLLGNASSYLRVILPSGETWSIQALGEGGQVCNPGILSDAGGHPHLVVFRVLDPATSLAVLLHAWHDGTTWRSEEMVRTNRAFDGMNSGMARLDPGGNPVVAWSEGYPPVPRIAFKGPDGAWKAETPGILPQAEYGVGNADLALPPDGSMALLATAADGQYLITRSPGGTWSLEAVPLDAIPGVSGFWQGLTATPDGDLHLLDWTSGVAWKRRTSGGWTPAVKVDSLPGSFTVVGHTVSKAGNRIALWGKTAGMSVLHVLDGGSWSSLILGASTWLKPAVGFTGSGKLRVLQNTTGTWPDTTSYILHTEP